VQLADLLLGFEADGGNLARVEIGIDFFALHCKSVVDLVKRCFVLNLIIIIELAIP